MGVTLVTIVIRQELLTITREAVISHKYIQGFPQLRGTIWAVPLMRTSVFWGLYWGPLLFGKPPYMEGRTKLCFFSNYHEGILMICRNGGSRRRISTRMWQPAAEQE